MKSSKSFFKRPIGIITGALIGALLITMTISDIYYSKLERDYPLLISSEQTNGTILKHKEHFDYTYIELNSSERRLIRPTENLHYTPSKFSDFIAEGDQMIYEKQSGKIQIIRDNYSYYFEFIDPHKSQ